MLADSHIHLFEKGYKNSGKDEVSQYEILMGEHSITCALVVGYEGEPWALGNNKFISSLVGLKPWVHPLAFIRPDELDLQVLEEFRNMGFEGISLYLFAKSDAEKLLQVPNSVWQWILDRGWITSVNSKGDYWIGWLAILEKYPELTLLISHLGLPTIETENLHLADIELEMKNIRRLCDFENVYLKLSGFYALEPISPSYPYPSLDPYLRYILDKFGVEKLIWGSDFSPALRTLDFAQTFQHLQEIPNLNPSDLSRIFGENLIELLSGTSKKA